MPTKKTSRLDSLRREAARNNLYVGTYSPGDGVTRYRFFRSRGGRSCGHLHQTKKAAEECAKKQAKKYGGTWYVSSAYYSH